MAEAGPDKWRERCLALAEELDARQAFWERAEKSLAKVLARLICAFDGWSEQLDPPLEQLREISRRGLLDGAGLRQLEAVADVLLRTSEEVRRQRTTSEQSLHRHLLRLLQAIEIPPALHELAQRLMGSLQQGGALVEALDGTARLLAEIDLRLRRERMEIEDFLAQLASKLHRLTAQTQEVGQALGRREVSWNQTLAVEIDRLRVQALAETELGTLKLTIVAQLDVLSSQLSQLYAEEVERNAQMVRQIAALTERLKELEQESQELRQRLEAAHRQALSDPVTGLPNRKAVDERLEQEFSRWQRFQQPLSLLLWDIDHFKQINDRFGHQAGDKALQVISQVLRSGIREIDFVGRYGGEEFVMLLPGTDLAGAMKVAEKLREAVKRCGLHSCGKPVPITISCGLTCARPGDTQASLFERADQALYQAKQAGRDRCISK